MLILRCQSRRALHQLRLHSTSPVFAAVCEELGKPLVYREWALGLTPAGHVRIRVAAAGVNYAELLQVRGLYQEKKDPPFVPGNECAGEVEELGAGCEDSALQVGDRVVSLARGGGYGSSTVVPWQFCVPLGSSPEAKAADLSEAAALLLAYSTAHLALTRRARVQAGETLLVTAAAGGVGLAAVELGRLLGLRVIAACGTEEKLQVAKLKGAEAGILYGPDAGDFREQLKAAAGRAGVDVVVDMVGTNLDQAIRSLNWEGRAVVVGFSGGSIPKVPANLLLLKNASVLGVFFGGYLQREGDFMKSITSELVAWWLQGRIKPTICATLPLKSANDAFRMLDSRRATGKVVLTAD